MVPSKTDGTMLRKGPARAGSGVTGKQLYPRMGYFNANPPTKKKTSAAIRRT
jgi:hypothetical protein